jgi:hypothetical protein
VAQHTYDRGGAAISHGATTPLPPNHLFTRTIWSRSCHAGQRSSGGLLDSSRHGQVRLYPATPSRSTDLHARIKNSIYGPLYHDRLNAVDSALRRDIALTTSTKPMRHPSRERYTPIFLACSVSYPSPMASQRTRFPFTTPLQFKRTPLARPSSCVHPVHLTC